MDWYNTVVNFFKDGGFFLYPLVIIFVVGVAISHRALALPDDRDRAQPLALGRGRAAPGRRQLQGRHPARERVARRRSAPCSSTAWPVCPPRVAATTSSRRWKSRCSRSSRVSRSAPTTCRSLANIGMLIGLLGTILALIHAFGAVAQANPAEKAALLAAAISEAMNNTAVRSVRRHHAAAGAHVPGSQDHLADRQPGNRRGEVPELHHRALLGTRRARSAGWHGPARSRSPSCLIARSSHD